jgi:hypothetical protein
VEDIRREHVPGLLLAHQPEAQMARRHAGRAAAGAGIADEIRDIGPVPAFGDADAAIRAVRNDLAGIVLHAAHKARAGPFPDVAADVEQAVLVGTEAAEGLRPAVGGTAFGLALIAGDPALRWIVVVDRQAIIAELAPANLGRSQQDCLRCNKLRRLCGILRNVTQAHPMRLVTPR